MRAVLPALFAVSFVAPLAAQEEALPSESVAPAATPVTPVVPVADHSHSLPTGTQITLRMSETVTTKGKTWSEGDSFKLAVASDVRLGNFIVIPQDSTGPKAWFARKSVFALSAKRVIEVTPPIGETAPG